MSTAVTTGLVTLFAAVLAAVMFLSPIGVSLAQDDETEESPEAEQGEGEDRPGHTYPDAEERAARVQELLDAFAAELGVTADDVVAAARAVAIDQVEQRLADGLISEERAAAIIERIESAEPGSILGRGLGIGFGGPGDRWGHHRGFGHRHRADAAD